MVGGSFTASASGPLAIVNGKSLSTYLTGQCQDVLNKGKNDHV